MAKWILCAVICAIVIADHYYEPKAPRSNYVPSVCRELPVCPPFKSGKPREFCKGQFVQVKCVMFQSKTDWAEYKGER